MYWYDPIILYSIVIMIVHLTQTTTEKIPYQNEFVTNRTMKDRIFIDDFITLFNSEKKFLPLTSNDLSEDTSEYGTSSAIGKRNSRLMMINQRSFLVNQHRSSDSNINDSTDDFDEFLGINTKEFDRELVEKAVTSDGSGESMCSYQCSSLSMKFFLFLATDPTSGRFKSMKISIPNEDICMF